MPKYGRIESIDPPIVAFYDTDMIDYPDLPGDLVALSDADWALRLTGSRWTITNGRLVAVPPGPVQQAANDSLAILRAGLQVRSTSNPSISSTYALDPQTLDQVGAVARDYASGMGLPGGMSWFAYPDIWRNMHQFSGPDIVRLYQAMRNFIFQLQGAVAAARTGETPVWPDPYVLLD